MRWSPESMALVRVQMLREDANAIAVALAAFGSFEPTAHEDRALSERFPEFPAQRYRSLYAEATARMQKIASQRQDVLATLPQRFLLGQQGGTRQVA